MVTPREYTAATTLQINTRQEQVTKMDDILTGMNVTDAAIRTELDVITSRKVALRVVRNLNLVGNSDFVSGRGLTTLLKNLVAAALTPLSAPKIEKPTVGLSMSAPETATEAGAVSNLLSHMNVDLRPRSFTIEVKYTAATPQLAMQIANAIGQEYLNNQLEERFDATKRANDWINQRLKQLQQNVQQAELAVRKFREANNLTETTKGVTINDQQLSELNSQLILSRAQLAEAEAKVVATRRGIGTTGEVLNNPLIQNLRIQETEVRRKMSDLASRYGPMHPRMQTVRSELSNVQSKIGEEMSKIRGSLDNDIDMSRARVRTMEEQLQALQKQGQMASGPAVQLAELERLAEAERSLYESFLQRGREIAQMDFVQADARIISAATQPGKPSNPKPTLWLMMAVVLGLGLGVGLMLLLELLDSGFRTTAQIESHLGAAPLGLLGELNEENIINYVVNKPTSAFTEGVRAVRTALQYANPDKPVKVVMITSSVPQEGKSIFAVSLAQMTAHSGAKVLLVDADLRRPSLARKLGMEPKVGLADVLVGQAKAKDALLVEKESGLHVMPALANTQFAQELLNSERMSKLLDEWRKTYDLVVLDCPPVMAVADAVTLSKLVDTVVFVARWGTTPRVLAAHAMRQLRNAHATISGVVLTRVDLEKQQAYGYGDYGYYYGKYKEYYTE